MKKTTLLLKNHRFLRQFFTGMLCVCGVLLTSTVSAKCHEFLDFTATKLRSKEQINFCEQFAGKTLLVVNTASQCGYTSQFADLEALYQENKESLDIVGFPSNDFKQEYSDSEKVADVCFVNYGVTFSMLEPSSVKGAQANDLFKKLAAKTGHEPKWNFNKYLISADGSEVLHFASTVNPNGEKLKTAIRKVQGTLESD